ncbi:hypothetical protein KIN20_038366 [Parelaphostrongylus tenuis]|uniref:Uncharacterized protein n=1 Tax=Parelaphostrongylus tenuis TaxID=148309 RepID=A0AAD5WMH4_PARTN|nr:hypothetical protein KIN20_038366 [Parelaphostrongylus tenuis]
MPAFFNYSIVGLKTMQYAKSLLKSGIKDYTCGNYHGGSECCTGGRDVNTAPATTTAVGKRRSRRGGSPRFPRTLFIEHS